MNKARKGFTLIEMLIVVGIIGIIVAIAVPALSTSMTDARQAKIDAYISQLNTALNRYVIDQEVDNKQEAITSIADGWTKLAPYLTIKGSTNVAYAKFVEAVCNNGTIQTIEGGSVAWVDDVVTVTGVSKLKCQGN